MATADAPDQPVGPPVPDWTARPRPMPTRLDGRTCSVAALEDAHRAPLYDALVAGAPDTLWTYMAQGPFASRVQFDAYLDGLPEPPGGWPMVVLAPEPVGLACYLRTDAANGSTEVGWITLAPTVQRTTAATEAIALMLRHAFDDLGYRRFEWKCDALNAASRRAAERFGFTYEGTFRQAVVYKGRNRDTAWFSITDAEWQRLRAAYDAWLAAENFDGDGRQRTSLAELTRAALG